MLASYLGVSGCREMKCVRLLPMFGWMSGGESVNLLPRCGLVSGGEMC